jgi:hypothetical protein
VRTRAIAIVVAALAAAPASATAAAPARAAGVRDCHTWVSYPNTMISSVRNMRCKRAARDLRHYQGPIKYRFTTPGGFHCKRVSGMSLGGQWRCVRGGKAYRFEFGD